MELVGKATRTVNDKGNQVLNISGRVISNGGSPVLPPMAEAYDLRILNFNPITGEVIFEFEVEVINAGKPALYPKTVSELSRHEQAEVFELQNQGKETKDAVEQVSMLSVDGQVKEIQGELAEPENN